MKVLIDANILLSAYVFRSTVERAVILFSATYGELYITKHVIEEVELVLKEKFPAKAKFFPEYIDFLSKNHGVNICQNLNQENEFLASLIRDKDDIPILLTLFDTKLNPDFYITKDKDFLALKAKLNKLGISVFEIIHPKYFKRKFPYIDELSNKLKDNKKLIDNKSFKKINDSLVSLVKLIPIRRID